MTTLYQPAATTRRKILNESFDYNNNPISPPGKKVASHKQPNNWKNGTPMKSKYGI